MMQVIGVKRLIILFVLVSFNAVFAAAIYLYIIPEKASIDRDLRALRSKVNTLQSDIDRMHVEFEMLDKQQSKFESLKKSGFFSRQVRSDARKLFSEIQDESGVVSAVAMVKSGVITNHPEAQKANHDVLMSAVEIEVKAFDEISIYRYIDIALRKFPGHLSVDIVLVRRLRDTNSTILRAIASGEKPELVGAKIYMSWRTIIPVSQVIKDGKT